MKKMWTVLMAALVLTGILTACGAQKAPEAEAEQGSDPVVSTPEKPEKITFPYKIPDSPLVIESVNSYNGRYLEDGSDIEIAGVSALLLTNTGSECVDYARVQLTGSKTNQEYVLSGLEAGASILVQESGKGPAVEQDCTGITLDLALTDSFEKSESVLKLEETETGKLRVTNLSDELLPCVRVFYKFYQEDEELYVGGITYVAKLENVEAGDSVEALPAHYTIGGSRVIMAKIYEEGAV